VQASLSDRAGNDLGLVKENGPDRLGGEGIAIGTVGSLGGAEVHRYPLCDLGANKLSSRIGEPQIGHR
jgi:hypothetical protein